MSCPHCQHCNQAGIERQMRQQGQMAQYQAQMQNARAEQMVAQQGRSYQQCCGCGCGKKKDE